MRERTDVFVVRPRFQPPLVEQARIGVTTAEGTELRFTPRVPLKPGERVKLLAKTESGRFSCIAAALRGSPGVWVRTGEWKMLELRENDRLPSAIPAILRAPGSNEMSGTIENISPGGFLVVSPAPPRGKELTLVAFVDDTTEDQFPCRVVDSRRQDGRYLIHLALDTGSEKTRTRLADLFERHLAASECLDTEAEAA